MSMKAVEHFKKEKYFLHPHSPSSSKMYFGSPSAVFHIHAVHASAVHAMQPVPQSVVQAEKGNEVASNIDKHHKEV